MRTYMLRNRKQEQKTPSLDEQVKSAREAYDSQLSKQARRRAWFPAIVLLLLPLLCWLFVSGPEILYGDVWPIRWTSLVIALRDFGYLVYKLLGIGADTSLVWFLWVLALLVTIPLFYWFVEFPVTRKRKRLQDLEDELRSVRLGDPAKYVQEEYPRLRMKTASAFHDNVDRYEIAIRSLNKASKLISNEPNKEQALEAFAYLEGVSALIQREQQELHEQSMSRNATISFIVGYVFLLLLMVLDFRNWSLTAMEPIDLLFVPPSIIFWSAVGSLAAMLFRFFNSTNRVRFGVEMRWLIARPVFGVIMGSLTFIVVVCGLLVLTPMSTNNLAEALKNKDPYQQIIGFGLFWVLAFLAGFSDKFYENILKGLLGKLTIQEETKTKSIEEVHKDRREASAGSTEMERVGDTTGTR